MKYVRFYLEYESPAAKKRGGPHTGNVIAAILREDGNFQYTFDVRTGEDGKKEYVAVGEVISAIFFSPNSPVCGGGADLGYIHDQCKRISERKAREIHPALFEYLDNLEEE